MLIAIGCSILRWRQDQSVVPQPGARSQARSWRFDSALPDRARDHRAVAGIPECMRGRDSPRLSTNPSLARLSGFEANRRWVSCA